MGTWVANRSLSIHEVANESVPVTATVARSLAVKVVDNDHNAHLDMTWQDWSGATEVLRALDRRGYVIKRVRCVRSVNIKPDIFKYIIFIEIAGDQESVESEPQLDNRMHT